MKTIDINAELANLREGHELYSVLQSALKSRAVLERDHKNDSQIFWPAKHFNLDRVTIFRDASEEEREQILEACCRDLLEEAYWIEKLGMYFAAKMSLMAYSTEERMLYSLFAADEAVHFSWISSYVSAEHIKDANGNHFINLLNNIVRGEDKLTLTYMVQVILEGWGLNHYHALLRDSTDAGLSKVFESIIKDEARHHASGLILFNEQKPSSSQVESLVEMMSRLLFMVQVGPQSVVSQIEQVKGHLSRAQKGKIFEELQCEIETAKKLDVLKSLIRSAVSAEAIFEKLDRNGSFRSYSAFECAEAGS
ncbi:MAG TPA: ferritin-like domain-containing protein [Blastocatellia bacterium]|nr:ferritin-like domain-containing protein [Blastocatellia bacterium]